MVDHTDAVISLCDKIETLDLDETERALLHLLVDVALEHVVLQDAENGDDVEGFGADGETAGAGLRESVGRVAALSTDALERRTAFNASADHSYEALPPI